MRSTFPKRLARPVPAATLVEAVGDEVGRVALDGREIGSVADPMEAESDSLVFCSRRTQAAVAEIVAATSAAVVVTPVEVATRPDQGLIVVDDPLSWFIRALAVLFPQEREPAIHPAASVDPGAEIGADVAIGMGTFVDEGCRIGARCRIGTNCHLGPGTVLGDDCFVQDNVCIGGVGLGYHQTPDHGRLFFPHLGAVIVGDGAVIGSGSVIVRGQLVDTVIGDRARLGNLVNIGHNVKIGSESVLSSGTCVAGGVHIGERCNIAVGVSINAKLRIGDDCQIGLGSVVTKPVADGTSVFGNPAVPVRTMRRF